MLEFLIVLAAIGVFAAIFGVTATRTRRRTPAPALLATPPGAGPPAGGAPPVAPPAAPSPAPPPPPATARPSVGTRVKAYLPGKKFFGWVVALAVIGGAIFLARRFWPDLSGGSQSNAPQTRSWAEIFAAQDDWTTPTLIIIAILSLLIWLTYRMVKGSWWAGALVVLTVLGLGIYGPGNAFRDISNEIAEIQQQSSRSTTVAGAGGTVTRLTAPPRENGAARYTRGVDLRHDSRIVLTNCASPVFDRPVHTELSRRLREQFPQASSHNPLDHLDWEPTPTGTEKPLTISSQFQAVLHRMVNESRTPQVLFTATPCISPSR